MRRIVVTGMGMVSPLGCSVEDTWSNLIEGRSGIKAIDRFEVSDLAARVAGLIPMGKGDPKLFDPDRYVSTKDQRKMDDFILYAMAAGQMAVEDAGIAGLSDEEKLHIGVMVGSGIGGLGTIQEAAVVLKEQGPRRISPFFIPSSLVNLATGHLSIKYGFKGPNHSAVTACATGAHAIGDAARLIQFEDADIMVAGGTEAAVCRLGIAGFAAARALCTSFNDRPSEASRPWSKDRDGFVMGEGAGVVVLEELEHAKKRGAKIYAEVVGYGLSGDAYHITAPSEDGDGAFRCMTAALKRAKMNPEDIDYVNAHGTSTMADTIELGAVKRTFGDAAYKISMSSTKSAIGHLLGAAGAVEAIFSILSIRDQIVPPTLNLRDPDDGCDIDLVPLAAKKRLVRAALSNSFGFGGTNAALVFKAAP